MEMKRVLRVLYGEVLCVLKALLTIPTAPTVTGKTAALMPFYEINLTGVYYIIPLAV